MQGVSLAVVTIRISGIDRMKGKQRHMTKTSTLQTVTPACHGYWGTAKLSKQYLFE